MPWEPVPLETTLGELAGCTVAVQHGDGQILGVLVTLPASGRTPTASDPRNSGWTRKLPVYL